MYFWKLQSGKMVNTQKDFSVGSLINSAGIKVSLSKVLAVFERVVLRIESAESEMPIRY